MKRGHTSIVGMVTQTRVGHRLPPGLRRLRVDKTKNNLRHGLLRAGAR
jgi:hypothetical protein